MNKIILYGVIIILIYKAISVSTNTDIPQDDEEEDWDDDESSEIDDDGRVYKNPRNSPSTECPRDEEQATLLGQKCLRKCSSDEDCKSKKKKCLCDGVCGMSCIKPDRECPELAQPSLGLVSVSGRHFGARAAYSCPHGYHVVGLQSRLCQADGNWAGAEPACKQNIYCLKPPQIEHARNSALPEQETFDLDSTVQYHCYNGYVTNGFPRAKCLAIEGQASWYGPDIQCEPRSCGLPSDPSNGWHAGECYTYGCKIIYNCGTGYELVGKHERFCQSDGSWIPKELPICVLVTSVICTTPENPKNGKATYTTLAYNSIVSYECRYGYTLVGESSSRCGADRKWSGVVPTCKEINCGHPGILYNGWIENIEAGTGLGASIIFRCNSEMLIHGHASSVCQIDGHWRNPIPECLAPCVVPTITQGYVIPIDVISDENETLVTTSTTHLPLSSGVEKVMHGVSLEVKCEKNYEFPVSFLSKPKCNNGTWSVIPRCIPARCKNMPKPPKNGMVLAPKSDHGMKARFKCKDGYKITSPHGKDITDSNEYVLTCAFGNWIGETPQCTEVYCAFPGYIPHGKVLLVGNMGLYDYRPYVKKIVNNKQIMYDCDKGYVLESGPPGATCVGGKWRPLDLPQCFLGQHPRLRWNRKRRSLQIRFLRTIYLMKNQRILKRQLEESRSTINKDPQWKIIYNGHLNNNNTGVERIPMSNINPTLKYDTHNINIKKTFNLITNSLKDNRSIQNETIFMGYLKTQIIRRRKRNSLFQNDYFLNKTTFNGAKRLRGYCEDLDWDSFGNINIVKQGKTSERNGPGIILQLECNAGFKLNTIGENSTVKCIRGVWKPETPKCISAPCLVPSIDHGNYYKLETHSKILPKKPSLRPLSTYTEIHSNEFIILECDEGYAVQGSKQIRCAHGSWSVNAFSECISVPCKLPFILGVTYEGGYRSGLTIANGSSVKVHCQHSTNTLPIIVSCTNGVLNPNYIHCESGLRKSREEFVTESKFNTTVDDQLINLEDIYDLDDLNNNTDEKPNFRESKLCDSPNILDGAMIYRNTDVNNDGTYDSGTEIYFNCIPGVAGERNTWKIICENGKWIGRSYNCANGTCLFRNNEPNVVNFYNDLEIREDIVEFPPGATIISRCIDIGKYVMVGSVERTCIHSEWTGNKPICYGLNQENDYAMEKPPTILFRHENGPISQSNDGKLIVYPGTTLHMECLWMRRFGNPKWNVSHEFRIYPEGWVTDAGRDSTLEYRLSIFNAVEDDSGTYTCQTPARHEHSVEVVVKAINCPEIPIRRGLILSTSDTKLSTRVLLSCANGNSLIGASELFCLPSGNWSSPLPVCESVECGDIPFQSNLTFPRVAILSREVGGRASFSCAAGYGLRGPSEAICLPSGEWASPFPICIEVQCEYPGAPQNGYAQGSAPYRAGDVVQFNCNPEYMMQGQPIIACQDNGRWSGGIPKCVQACSYPGTAISGRMSSVKFYYAIGESITFTCDAGLEIRGAKILKCLRNGKWSNAIPTCTSSDGINKVSVIG